MLFNSYEFLFVFLPVTLVGFYLLGRASLALALSWLAMMSFAFYASPEVIYGQFCGAECANGWLPAIALAGSMFTNFAAGHLILRAAPGRSRYWVTATAITANLSLLAYLKYRGFLVENIALLFGDAVRWDVVMPAGVSFYTFTQIAFLVDAYKGKVKSLRLHEYALFVLWFPHLIAGPILHHAEMIGQFKRPWTVWFQPRNVAVGLAIFSVGLFKKIWLSDEFAIYAKAVFAAPESASFVETWLGVAAYTLHIYFDFSGYSDMAIGLSRLFNVDLPLNFYSPYKATSIIDFWRRWHISLSRFLRDYLYIPLGGSRRGKLRRYVNLFVTMLLGGLWHGANWTFVIWGALHGTYLIVNHAWRQTGIRLPTLVAWPLTLLCVMIAWVFFNAPNMASALVILNTMATGNAAAAAPVIKEFWRAVGYVAVGSAIVLVLPNTQQLFSVPFNPRGSTLKESKPDAEPFNTLARWLAWKPSWVWAGFAASLLFASVMFFDRTSVFIYWQF